MMALFDQSPLRHELTSGRRDVKARSRFNGEAARLPQRLPRVRAALCRSLGRRRGFAHVGENLTSLGKRFGVHPLSGFQDRTERSRALK